MVALHYDFNSMEQNERKLNILKTNLRKHICKISYYYYYFTVNTSYKVILLHKITMHPLFILPLFLFSRSFSPSFSSCFSWTSSTLFAKFIFAPNKALTNTSFKYTSWIKSRLKAGGQNWIEMFYQFLYLFLKYIKLFYIFLFPFKHKLLEALFASNNDANTLWNSLFGGNKTLIIFSWYLQIQNFRQNVDLINPIAFYTIHTWLIKSSKKEQTAV